MWFRPFLQSTIHIYLGLPYILKKWNCHKFSLKKDVLLEFYFLPNVLNFLIIWSRSNIVSHHLAGPGSIPCRVRLPGWGFFRGFPSTVKQMSSHLSPDIIGHHLVLCIDVGFPSAARQETKVKCLWSNGRVVEWAVTMVKRWKGSRMSCDVDETTGGL